MAKNLKTMKYYFSDLEKSAIVRIAFAMSEIDNDTDIREVMLNVTVFSHLNIGEKHIDDTQSISVLDAMAILKNMTLEEKRFICSFLATIMCADQKIDDKELALWKLISTSCEFPPMHITEALNFFKNSINE